MWWRGFFLYFFFLKEVQMRPDVKNGFPSMVPGDIAFVVRAMRFATIAHNGQMRRYTNDPYILHPMMVAARVAQRTMDPHVIAAAVLHDVIEDTPFTAMDIGVAFGERVTRMVVALTDVPSGTLSVTRHLLNRAARKAIDRDRIRYAGADVQMIKAYDLMDNLISIKEHDPKFFKVFMKEKELLIEEFTELDPHVQLELKGFMQEMAK